MVKIIFTLIVIDLWHLMISFIYQVINLGI